MCNSRTIVLCISDMTQVITICIFLVVLLVIRYVHIYFMYMYVYFDVVLKCFTVMSHTIMGYFVRNKSYVILFLVLQLYQPLYIQ